MRVAIHQPEFMPWLGFFYKMALSDLYVVFDHVQFKKRYFENRNLIVSPKNETSYISAPVITKGRYTQAIKDTSIDNSQDWKDVLLKKIKHFYCKAPYFDKYYGDLCDVVNGREHALLLDFNVDIINFFRKHLGISVPMVYSSKMNVEEYKGSDLILQICISSNAKTYLCGSSGKGYLKEEDFSKKGIRIDWLEYKSPVYKQLSGTFISNMSTLDLLLNCGEESLSILMRADKKEGKQNLCIY